LSSEAADGERRGRAEQQLPGRDGAPLDLAGAEVEDDRRRDAGAAVAASAERPLEPELLRVAGDAGERVGGQRRSAQARGDDDAARELRARPVRSDDAEAPR